MSYPDKKTCVFYARSSETPHGLLLAMAMHPDPYVRWCVVRNMATPGAVLRCIAQQDLSALAPAIDRAISASIAQHPNAPPDIIHQLVNHPSPDVQIHAVNAMAQRAATKGPE